MNQSRQENTLAKRWNDKMENNGRQNIMQKLTTEQHVPYLEM